MHFHLEHETLASMLARISSGLVFVFAIATAGCGPKREASGPPVEIVSMTSQIVDSHGVRTFAAPRAQVFAATEGALRVLGYRIAFSDQSFTVLKTEPMLTLSTATTSGSVASYGMYGSGNYSGTTVATNYARSYTITFIEGAGGVAVRAAPRMYINGQDVSGSRVWELAGPSGEDAQWARLFSEIASNLQRAPAPASPPTPNP